MKHGWGLKDAWQRSRQVLMRWVTLLGVGYALTQMLAYTNPARLAGLARAAPWRPPGTQTAGVIQAGIAGISRELGPPAFRRSRLDHQNRGCRSVSATSHRGYGEEMLLASSSQMMRVAAPRPRTAISMSMASTATVSTVAAV